MASGSAIRGTRVGSGPIRPPERGEPVPRRVTTYWCANGHSVRPSFAVDVPPPKTWDCPKCGLPAGRDEENPPAPPRNEPYKSHLAYVKERRSDEDGAAILAEALADLRQRRGEPR
ncbi:MAG TPA: RNA polymerase-binding protein RbpA [Micromonosporaceae bacterium]|nr:RNA polymerase-binding protein RbpA [Micromonosporaceae bacterium]